MAQRKTQNHHRAVKTELHFTLKGTFAVKNKDGICVRPAGVKSRALLAMLVLAKDMSRPRAFFRKTLWSDRAPEQAAGSLRQTISEIKKAMIECNGAFGANRNSLWLDPSKVACDLLDEDLHSAAAVLQTELILEDLDIRDNAFKLWLENVRRQYSNGVSLAASIPSDIGRKRLSVLNVLESSNDKTADMLGEEIKDLIANGIANWADVDILENAFDEAAKLASESDLILVTKTTPSLQGPTLRLGLYHPEQMRRIWVSTAKPREMSVQNEETPFLHRLANQCVDQVLSNLAQNSNKSLSEDTLGVVSTIRAVRKIFDNDVLDLNRLRNDLINRYEIYGNPVLLAWAAYTITYVIGERRNADAYSLQNEAESLIRRALQEAEGNYMVTALASHIYSFVFNDYFTGYDLACRSIRLNASNPLAWTFRALANMGLGRTAESFSDAMWARSISGEGPYTSLVNGIGCAAATVSGNRDQAVLLGESSMRLHPTYSAPLRFLYAIYDKERDRENSNRIFKTIKSNEPDFSKELLKESMYPIPILRKSGLIDLNEPKKAI